MTNEQINVAIAQACGWTILKKPLSGFGFAAYAKEPNGDPSPGIPDYCDDLNAMHEALVLLNTWRLRDNYFGWLREILDAEFDNWKVYAASPRHCAEALLRTLGKWEEVQQ